MEAGRADASPKMMSSLSCANLVPKGRSEWWHQPERAPTEMSNRHRQPAKGLRAAQPIEMTRMGRTIARRMAQSKFSAPEFILTAEFDMTEARALLKSVAGAEKAPKIGPNDLLIKAVATALTRHPEINSGWENDGIVRFGRVNVGNAVALPGGLVVPVIHDADQKTLGQIATESKSLIDKARAGKLAPHEYEGGTFTVSNLGMYGIDQFTAILNPPEACILAVGAITPKPVVVDGAGRGARSHAGYHVLRSSRDQRRAGRRVPAHLAWTAGASSAGVVVRCAVHQGC